MHHGRGGRGEHPHEGGRPLYPDQGNGSNGNAKWEEEDEDEGEEGLSNGKGRSQPDQEDARGEKAGLLHPDEYPMPSGWRRFLLRAKSTVKDTNFLFMLGLLVFVIAFGTANRVLYKIQLVPMQNYAIFISWVLTLAYCFLYFGIFSVRRYGLFIITDDQVSYVFSRRGLKLILMGLMDALGFVIGIFAARKISGFLLTLLPQGIIPMSMVVAFIILRTRFHWGQILGAAVLVAGLIVSLVPDLESKDSGGRGATTAIWAVIYFFSSLPNAISFVLKELVFKEKPTMDIFVVNSFDSLWQLFFSIVLFPLVLVPGFSSVTFKTLPDYIPHGASCLIGFTPTSHDDCNGEPWIMMMYVCVNLSWNISLLLLLKRGGAVLTFIGAAVSLPLSHLAFAIDWPLLGAEKLNWEDGLALVIVLVGLVIYRYFSVVQKHKLEAASAAKQLTVQAAEEAEEEEASINADPKPKRF